MTVASRLLSLVVAAALVSVWPATARAQDGAAELRSLADEVAGAWQAGDIGRVASRFASDGVGVHTPAGSHPALSGRLARAALGDLHAGLGSGSARVLRSRLLGGSPARAFTEISWRPRADGTSEAVLHTVFVGLQWTEDAWRIVEIRVLPGEKQLPPDAPAAHPHDERKAPAPRDDP